MGKLDVFCSLLQHIALKMRHLPKRLVLGTRVWGQGDEGPPVRSRYHWFFDDRSPALPATARLSSPSSYGYVSSRQQMSEVVNFLLLWLLSFLYKESRKKTTLSRGSSKSDCYSFLEGAIQGFSTGIRDALLLPSVSLGFQFSQSEGRSGSLIWKQQFLERGSKQFYATET